MRVKVISVATYQGRGLDQLKNSMDKFGIDYEILCQGQAWLGFGMKILETVKYLKTLQGYTHFMFVDAYDVVFLHSIHAICNKYRAHYAGQIVFSSEKGCWPDPSKADLYPQCETPWKFLNSGGYMGPIDKFLNVVGLQPPRVYNDDQAYFTDWFLAGAFALDTNCRIFQSIAFEDPADFVLNGSLINNRTGTMPSVIHGNGRTAMDKIYSLI